MSSDASAVLALPYIQPAQAQKHVTHNEALRLLDLLVQLAVTSRSQTSPPASPTTGDRYLVPADALEGFAGQEGRIALWDGDGWTFVAPQPGWQAQVLDEGLAVVFDGSGWLAPADRGHSFGSLGIQATADATNRLAVSAPATLLTHAGAGHQLKLNRAAAADTASLLFQTGWSARAEMGTIGAEDFEIRTSPDGSTFHTALRAAAAGGRLTAPAGLSTGPGSAAAPGLAFDGDADTGLLHPAADQIGFSTGGTQRALLSNTALNLSVPVTGTAVAANATDATSGTLARFFASGIHGLGTASPPVLSASPDSLGARQISTGFSAYNSANLTDVPDHPVSWVHSLLTLAAGPNVVGSGNTRRNYLAVRTTGAISNARFWLGAHSNDNPVAWSEIFHQNYLVGTVSQSGGVPTGRVIERGSNANGDYLRLADGTQICSRSLNLGSRLAHGAGTYADPYRTGNNTWTFPAAFATAPTLAGAAEVNSTVGADKIHVIAIQARTTTSASGIQAIAGSGSAAAHNVTAHLIAIGRWF